MSDGQDLRPPSGGWDRFWFRPASPRALCRLRIVVGAAAVVWFATWLPDAGHWFGGSGRLSVASARELAPTPTARSLARPLGAPAVVWCGLVAAAALAAGVLTPLAGAAALLCLLAVVHRGPLLCGPAGAGLAMLLLYLLLAPSGRMWSWDARRGNDDRPTERARVAWRLIQLHLAALMVVSGLQQLGFSDAWWVGDASWWLIASEPVRLVDLTWLHDQPLAWNFLTHFAAAFPFAAGLLIWRRRLRGWILGLSCLYWPLLAAVTGELLYCGLMAAALCVASEPESLVNGH